MLKVVSGSPGMADRKVLNLPSIAPTKEVFSLVFSCRNWNLVIKTEFLQRVRSGRGGPNENS